MFIEAAVGLLALLLLGLIIYGPWQWLMTDIGRQIVFEKRDAIFDLALAGKLRFDDEGYRTIRLSLERSIRFAHELTVWRFVLLYAAASQRDEDDGQSDLQRAVDRIPDDDTRRAVAGLVNEAYAALVGMMCVKSPPFALVAVAVLLAKFLFPGPDRLVHIAGEKIQMEADRVLPVMRLAA